MSVFVFYFSFLRKRRIATNIYKKLLLLLLWLPIRYKRYAGKNFSYCYYGYYSFDLVMATNNEPFPTKARRPLF